MKKREKEFEERVDAIIDHAVRAVVAAAKELKMPEEQEYRKALARLMGDAFGKVREISNSEGWDIEMRVRPLECEGRA